MVLLTAGITHVRDQWPLSDRDIYRYCEEKYEENINDVRFYETIEIKDSSGRLILPAGKVVDGNFTITNPSDYTAILNPVIGVSNYEYEVRKNNAKRSIYILKKSYLQQYLNDMRTIMSYDKSSQFVNRKLVRTENTRNTMP